MDYIPGKGFAGFNDNENAEMARLGIGMPPVRPVEQSKQVYEQQPVPVVDQQVQYQQPVEPQRVSNEDVKARVDQYFNSIGIGSTQAQATISAQPVVNTNQQTSEPKVNDVFGSWFNQNEDHANQSQPVQPVEQKANNIVQDEGFIGYRRGIVEAAVKLGEDPADIERAIASMTPEEHAIFASIKLENERRMKSGQSAQPSVQPVKQMNPALQNALDGAFKKQPSPNLMAIPSSFGNRANADTTTYDVMASKINKIFR